MNKIILGLVSVGVIFCMMFPSGLSANHFRYGTMSWERVSDNGTHGTIRLKMENGWSLNHDWFRESDDYTDARTNYWGAGVWVSGYIGSIKADFYEIVWDDGTTNTAMDHKLLSRDNLTRGGSGNCAASGSNVCVNSTISELGDYSGGSWTTGVTHSFPDNGTTEYVIYWTGDGRSTVNNTNSSTWRHETKVNIGGAYGNNYSPVSAVPAVVQVQDNKIFQYQLTATDPNNDSLNFRWGKYNEFFTSDGSGSTDNFSKPAGMTLSSSGLVTWDIRDSTTAAGGVWTTDNATEDSLWVAAIMVEDLHDNGSVMSYIPVDFFFKIANASNDPPAISGIPNSTQTISIGNTKTFTMTSTDDSGVAPTVSVLNPPSDNISIWSDNTSTSGGETTFTISFSPDSSMDNKTYAVNIRSTDNESMTLDQSLGLRVTSVSNADPSVPTLLSPPDGSMVTNPVKFQWTESTDADNDSVSYTIYICTNSGFTGCSGTSVTAGVNFIPPFNQNFHDSLFSWPSPLQAAMIPQQISQDLAMIPKWLIMLSAFGLLSGLISFSLKNISHRKLVFMLILLIVILGLNINSCSSSDDTTSETATTPPSTTATDNTTDDGILSTTTTVTPSTTGCTTCVNYTADDKTDKTTYYWKVVATDNRSASSQSDTWSFTVKL